MSFNLFPFIKKYYQMNLYTDADIAVFVKSSDITQDQYKEITGEDY